MLFFINYYLITNQGGMR